MWKFWHTESVKPLSEKLAAILVQERALNREQVAALRLLEEPGHYANRRVTYFRVFDPAAVTPPTRVLQRLADLDPAWVLHAGHLERDGAVVLNGRRIEI